MKKNRIHQSFISLGIAMTLLAPVVGHARGRHGPQDTDGDGAISQTEVLTHARERFDRKDTNGDGCISWEEVETEATERFQRRDSDGNGNISPDEQRPRRGRGPDSSGGNDNEA